MPEGEGRVVLLKQEIAKIKKDELAQKVKLKDTETLEFRLDWLVSEREKMQCLAWQLSGKPKSIMWASNESLLKSFARTKYLNLNHLLIFESIEGIPDYCRYRIGSKNLYLLCKDLTFVEEIFNYLKIYRKEIESKNSKTSEKRKEWGKREEAAKNDPKFKHYGIKPKEIKIPEIEIINFAGNPLGIRGVTKAVGLVTQQCKKGKFPNLSFIDFTLNCIELKQKDQVKDLSSSLEELISQRSTLKFGFGLNGFTDQEFEDALRKGGVNEQTIVNNIREEESYRAFSISSALSWVVYAKRRYFNSYGYDLTYAYS